MLDREVLTVREVQDLLGLSRTTVYARLQDKSIRSIKLEGRYLIPKQAIRELLHGDRCESRLDLSQRRDELERSG